MQHPGLLRIDVGYLDGINTLVEYNVSKKVEPETMENMRSIKIGSLEKRKGYTALGNSISATANSALFYFENTNASGQNLFRISTVSATTSAYYLNGSNVWTILSGLGTSLTAATYSTTIAEDCCFLVNGSDTNRYISSDGVTVVDSTTTTGHLYGSPKANKINYYKDRLYVADYYIGTVRYKNSIMMSSNPLGIVGLVDGDFDAGVSTLNVTDSKYIYTNSDQLDIYRGNVLITTITVTSKTDYTIALSAPTSVPLKSSDGIWVKDTYGTNPRMYRWAANAASGIPARKYDTFKMGGGSSSAITMMTNIGDVMMISNKDSLMSWNNYSLMNYDSGYGCVSKNGYAKINSTLFFVHYTGIYATTGGLPKLVSSKVQKYFDGASKSGLENSVCGTQGISVFFYIGDVTLYNNDGSIDKVQSNVCLEYNLRQENWFISTNVPVTKISQFVSSTDPNKIVMAHKTNFKIYDFLVGQTDDDNEIPCGFSLSPLYLKGDYESFGYPRFAVVECETGSDGKFFVSLDKNDFYELNDAIKKGVNVLPITAKNSTNNDDTARCRQVRVAVKEISKAAFKVNRLSVLYTDSQEWSAHSQ